MSLRRRLLRLAARFGPPEPPRHLSPEERIKGILWWIGDETYNRGVFDSDPEFRPAWSHYHDLWQRYTHGYSPLDAVWLKRAEPDFEEARRRVAEIMIRVARLQPSPVNVLAKLLEWFEKQPDNGARHESETPDRAPRDATSPT